MNLRIDYEIDTEQKPISFARNMPANYPVGDMRYVEWLEEQIEESYAIKKGEKEADNE